MRCKYCDWDDAKTPHCGAHYKGYICTREKGHAGPHVACGATENDHPLMSWPNYSGKEKAGG